VLHVMFMLEVQNSVKSLQKALGRRMLDCNTVLEIVPSFSGLTFAIRA
jgi:hypothetical protein